MKASELRIGNYGIDREGRICIVDELSINEEPRIVAISGGLTSLPVTPIPLTEEWLLKFGFEIKYEISDIKGAFLGLNPITIDHMIYLTNVGDGWFYKNGFHKIQHVHQLQNLYFALTNEELKITL